MNRFQTRLAEASPAKAKAVEDARQMQASVIDAARRTGTDPPKYILMELIGKGSYGRVYKGLILKDMITAEIVAVKIIDIDESDTASPRNADSCNEFLKEISALKMLSESKARNINHIIDALPVAQTTWMITEYCGGGSVATLMKPTAPGGLEERWVIPIIREVAEAIKWVHNAGIIHRDIKCANVLITERGEVQLCDFGVAGTLETKLDKRSTFIGTLYWMAPELFDPNPSYGKEVDIWAFGCMVYEIATGLPPNVDMQAPYGSVDTESKSHAPRLEGSYSHDLRSLVEYCLQELPSSRPTIDQVQTHPYIWNSEARYPTSSLSYLVRVFKTWEDRAGSRESLFISGGAQSSANDPVNSTREEEWNFSTTSDFDQEMSGQSGTLDDAISEIQDSGEATARPQFQKPSRRRPPPHILARVPVPLEKIFDPNTISNYENNSRDHYGGPSQEPRSDLPLRDNTSQTVIRDATIDLDIHASDIGLLKFPDLEVIPYDERTSTFDDFTSSATNKAAGVNANRRTQDWTFPVTLSSASAEPEASRFQTEYSLMPPPELFASRRDHSNLQPPSLDRLSMSRVSLIDLDMSLPELVSPSVRPSTANSDTSTSSDQMVPGNPFELEKHSSLSTPPLTEDTSSHGYYLPEESGFPHGLLDSDKLPNFSSSNVEFTQRHSPTEVQATVNPYEKHIRTLANRPKLPPPPSERALTGVASKDELKGELKRMLNSMSTELESFQDLLTSAQALQREKKTSQRQSREKNKDWAIVYSNL